MHVCSACMCVCKTTMRAIGLTVLSCTLFQTNIQRWWSFPVVTRFSSWTWRTQAKCLWCRVFATPSPWTSCGIRNTSFGPTLAMTRYIAAPSCPTVSFCAAVDLPSDQPKTWTRVIEMEWLSVLQGIVDPPSPTTVGACPRRWRGAQIAHPLPLPPPSPPPPPFPPPPIPTPLSTGTSTELGLLTLT